jgi:hypothetical protein
VPPSSGQRCRVVMRYDSKISKDRTAFIFRVKMSCSVMVGHVS